MLRPLSLSSIAVLALLVAPACSSASSTQQVIPPDQDASTPSDAQTEEPGDAAAETAKPDPCKPNPCSQPLKTQCTVSNGAASCQCDVGAHEEAGQCVADSKCEPTTCGGHGTCAMVSGAPKCTCSQGYSGAHCEQCASDYYPDGSGGCTKTPCDPNPCKDPTRLLCKVTASGAVCECNAGTHEEAGQCVADVTCSGTTCNGHGTCSEVDAGVVCACDNGYTGPTCSDCASGYHADGSGGCTSDPCVPNPCTAQNETVCGNSGGQAVCSCDPGYHDDGPGCVIDQTCTSSSCSGHGSCSIAGGVIHCDCSSGYTGLDCSQCATGFHSDGSGGCTDNPCVPNPCTGANKTVCTANGAQAVCSCDAGYHDDAQGGCSDDPCVPNLCAAQNKACHVVGGQAECYTPVCNDGNPCTEDALVGGSCVNTKLSGVGCSTSLCMIGQMCSNGVCGGGTVVTCNDDNPCTADSCESATGCKNTADDTLVPDDGIGCTADKCVAGVKQHTPSNALCDDGLYCTGVESCSPGAIGADGQGCVRSDVPQPPQPSTTCAKYTCDESSHAFKLTTSVGTPCDDGIACTTGDKCDAQGGCAGAVTGSCVSETCGSTTALGVTVDISTARVQGSITLAGGAVPTSLTPAQYEGDVRVYLRAADTEVLHQLGEVRYSSGYPNYSLVGGSGKVDTLIPPGIYDLVYEHDTYGSPVSFVYRSSTDPFPAGFRVLTKGIVVGTGLKTMNVDLVGGRVTGAIKLGGGAVPGSLTPAQYEGDVRLYLRARDTQVLHDLGDVRYSSGYPNYSLVSGSGTIDTLVPPGSYDLVYSHDTYGSPVSYVYRSAEDPFPAGYRVLAQDVVVSAGSQTLDVDLAGGRVTGNITLAGAAVPSTLTPAQYEGDVRLYLRARDTQVLHDLGDVRYSSGYPNYGLVSGSGKINTLVPPGVYDLVYEHDTYGNPVSHVYRASADPFPAGYRVLRESITVTAGANALDVDLTGGRVTGVIKLAGAPPPASLTPAQYEGDVRVYLRSRDTQVLHDLGDVRYSSGYPNYSLVSGSGTIDTMVPPGAYDLVYQHDTYGSPVTHVYRSSTDPFPAGYRVLSENILVGSGSTTLDVDLSGARVTGTIKLAGAAPPSTLTPAQYEGDVRLYLRARDTRVQHDLGEIRYSSGYPNYSLVSGSGTIDTMVPPGVYDVLYEHDTYGSPVTLVYRSSDDPFPAGYRVLTEGVTLSAGSSTLDVNITGARALGAITLTGAAPPAMLTPAQYEGDVRVYLRARDTLVLHQLGEVRYSSGYPNYSLVNGSGKVDTLVPPGVYDLVYEHDTYGNPVSLVYRSSADPFPAGYRLIRGCVTVP